jgi:hypothetical protein
MVPGLLGLALGLLHHRRRAAPRGGRRSAWSAGIALAALGLIAVLVYQGRGWHEVRVLNATRDAEVERQREAIHANKAWLGRLVAANPERAPQLIAEMAATTEDRTLLIPLASRPETPPEVLDRLVRHPDLGVALTALRDPDIPVDSIVWLYRNHSYPDYFFSTLAGHPRTPPWILAELYDKRGRNAGIPRGLAHNPNTPADIRTRLRAEGVGPADTP